ncbi:hypothetical protein HPP92_026017, partial [Vanilla planifolia]
MIPPQTINTHPQPPPSSVSLTVPDQTAVLLRQPSGGNGASVTLPLEVFSLGNLPPRPRLPSSHRQQPRPPRPPLCFTRINDNKSRQLRRGAITPSLRVPEKEAEKMVIDVEEGSNGNVLARYLTVSKQRIHRGGQRLWTGHCLSQEKFMSQVPSGPQGKCRTTDQ